MLQGRPATKQPQKSVLYLKSRPDKTGKPASLDLDSIAAHLEAGSPSTSPRPPKDKVRPDEHADHAKGPDRDHQPFRRPAGRYAAAVAIQAAVVDAPPVH